MPKKIYVCTGCWGQWDFYDLKRSDIRVSKLCPRCGASSFEVREKEIEIGDDVCSNLPIWALELLKIRDEAQRELDKGLEVVE